MATWRRWAYLRALLRVGRRTVIVMLAAAFLLPVALFSLSFSAFAARDCFCEGSVLLGCFAVAFGGGGLILLTMAVRMPRDYFGRRPGPDPVWEWPSDIVRREEQERREAHKGIELMASAPPEGSGTELESGTAPEGRGTELTAGEDVAERPPMPRERA